MSDGPITTFRELSSVNKSSFLSSTASDLKEDFLLKGRFPHTVSFFLYFFGNSMCWKKETYIKRFSFHVYVCINTTAAFINCRVEGSFTVSLFQRDLITEKKRETESFLFFN